MLLQFLLDYPVGEKRLDSHLQFLLVNLAYEHETGRLAASGALEAVVARFPPTLLTARAELLFLPLAARLVNDPSPQCAFLVCHRPFRRHHRHATVPCLPERLLLQWLGRAAVGAVSELTQQCQLLWCNHVLRCCQRFSRLRNGQLGMCSVAMCRTMRPRPWFPL